MDIYHCPELINRYHKPGDALNLLLEQQEWLRKNWTTLSDEKLQSQLVPSDFFCWSKRAHELHSTSKQLYQEKERMDGLAPFYKCSGCQLIRRLLIYPWLEIKNQKFILSGGAVSHKDKNWILPPRHTNVLLSVLFQNTPYKHHFQHQLLTYNCGEQTYCLRHKFLTLDNIVPSEESIKRWIKTLYDISMAFPTLVWNCFDKTSLCISAPDNPTVPANLIQLRNFDRCAVKFQEQNINLETKRGNAIHYLHYLLPKSYPSDYPIVNFYLYLLALLSYSNIYKFVGENSTLLNFLQGFFRPSEFSQLWNQLKTATGTDLELKSMLTRYFYAHSPNLKLS